jgi:hypothetical protein
MENIARHDAGRNNLQQTRTALAALFRGRWRSSRSRSRSGSRSGGRLLRRKVRLRSNNGRLRVPGRRGGRWGTTTTTTTAIATAAVATATVATVATTTTTTRAVLDRHTVLVRLPLLSVERQPVERQTTRARALGVVHRELSRVALKVLRTVVVLEDTRVVDPDFTRSFVRPEEAFLVLVVLEVHRLEVAHVLDRAVGVGLTTASHLGINDGLEVLDARGLEGRRELLGVLPRGSVEGLAVEGSVANLCGRELGTKTRVRAATRDRGLRAGDVSVGVGPVEQRQRSDKRRENCGGVHDASGGRREEDSRDLSSWTQVFE